MTSGELWARNGYSVGVESSVKRVMFVIVFVVMAVKPYIHLLAVRFQMDCGAKYRCIYAKVASA